MKLPSAFVERMRELLDEEEYEDLMRSLEEERTSGIRVNTLKIGVDSFRALWPFPLEPVPWAADGFYCPPEANPGRHPYYHAGLYYIQEPSTMMPAAVLGVKPGERVLDLCAAPGGKSVQLAAAMGGEGLLVCNDVNPKRIKALVKNIELCGVTNALVTNEQPRRLAEKFAGFFDAILVDAPCSGEGMFRKDSEAVKSWDNYKSEMCAKIQRDILIYAHEMLKPCGRLVYSTCTFSPLENEMAICGFLDSFRDCELVDIPRSGGVEGGRPGWAEGRRELLKAARLWPHKVRGEGHFVALIVKRGEKSGEEAVPGPEDSPGRQSMVEGFKEFEAANLNTDMRGHFLARGNHLWRLNVPCPDMEGIKAVKLGLYLGEFSEGRFVPSHPLALSLKMEDFKRVLNFKRDSDQVNRYLKGETLLMEGEAGYTAVCVDGFPLGWAKQMPGMLKNLYPKGWRKMN